MNQSTLNLFNLCNGEPYSRDGCPNPALPGTDMCKTCTAPTKEKKEKITPEDIVALSKKDKIVAKCDRCVPNGARCMSVGVFGTKCFCGGYHMYIIKS
jgi:hypothetical protein